ncbi:hypothetical protein DAI22_01g211200 [Oryza sativa Japonica Group]|nr:hypothetical protein DAI22_01g211200 [Oryza sativa Japonica Group]
MADPQPAPASSSTPHCHEGIWATSACVLAGSASPQPIRGPRLGQPSSLGVGPRFLPPPAGGPTSRSTPPCFPSSMKRRIRDFSFPSRHRRGRGYRGTHLRRLLLRLCCRRLDILWPPPPPMPTTMPGARVCSAALASTRTATA